MCSPIGAPAGTCSIRAAALLALPASAGTDPISSTFWAVVRALRNVLPEAVAVVHAIGPTTTALVHNTPIDINCHCFDPDQNQRAESRGVGQRAQRSVGRQPDHIFFDRLPGLSSSHGKT